MTLASLAAQHYGDKAGGFIAGLPSTAVVSLLFIAYTHGAAHAYEATGVFPLSVAIYGIFLSVYAALAGRYGYTKALVGATFAWCVLEYILFRVHPSSDMLWILAASTAVFLLSCLFVRGLHIPGHGPVPVRTTPGRITLQAMASGAIVAAAVAGSRFGGPVLGGILSAFPAVAISTLAVTARNAGVGLTRAMVLPMIVSGIINCTVFALAFRYTVAHARLLEALVLSYSACMVSAFFTYTWLNRKKATA